MPNTGVIVFVVGHSHWGKSQTLKALTDDSSYQKDWIADDGTGFKLRRTSNDDRKRKDSPPKRYLEFMESRQTGEMIIAALCPNFDDPNALTEQILDSLKQRGFRMFFWVIGRQFKSGKVMPREDVTRIERFGRVEVENELIEADERARRFKKFIAKTVLKPL